MNMTQEMKKTAKFSNLKIEKKLLESLIKKHFKVPTPIQNKIIPTAIEGKDVFGIAQTGTGKTLAFGIPMIQRIMSPHNTGQGLVLVPTRELALQVDQELMKIGSDFGLRTAVLIGGTSQVPQVRALRRDPHIIIATPGRLVDLLNQGIYRLNRAIIITLDEADRMLDVGFLPEIKRILKNAPKQRQTMLFSATMSHSITSLASEFMKTPLKIEVAPQGTAAANTAQEVYVVQKKDKMRLADSLLAKYSEDKVLIFSRTKHGAKKIARDIRDMGHTATEIHSNRSQRQRQTALDGFKQGKFRILVATDIAARGIDVRDIGLVINFDIPGTTEDYVHRIGRTGRAGRYGKAISFITSEQRNDIKKIERLIRKKIPVLTLPELPPQRPKTFNNKIEDSNTNYQSRRRRGNSNPYSKNNRRQFHGRRHSSTQRRGSGR